MVVEFLYLIPFSVFALVGIVSIYLYIRRKKTGFMLIGIGFLANALSPLIYLALGAPYIPFRLMESGLTEAEVSQFMLYLSLVEWSLLAIFAALVIVGLFLLMKGTKPKQIP